MECNSSLLERASNDGSCCADEPEKEEPAAAADGPTWRAQDDDDEDGDGAEADGDAPVRRGLQMERLIVVVVVVLLIMCMLPRAARFVAAEEGATNASTTSPNLKDTLSKDKDSRVIAATTTTSSTNALSNVVIIPIFVLGNTLGNTLLPLLVVILVLLLVLVVPVPFLNDPLPCLMKHNETMMID